MSKYHACPFYVPTARSHLCFVGFMALPRHGSLRVSCRDPAGGRVLWRPRREYLRRRKLQPSASAAKATAARAGHLRGEAAGLKVGVTARLLPAPRHGAWSSRATAPASAPATAVAACGPGAKTFQRHRRRTFSGILVGYIPLGDLSGGGNNCEAAGKIVARAVRIGQDKNPVDLHPRDRHRTGTVAHIFINVAQNIAFAYWESRTPFWRSPPPCRRASDYCVGRGGSVRPIGRPAGHVRRDLSQNSGDLFRRNRRGVQPEKSPLGMILISNGSQVICVPTT